MPDAYSEGEVERHLQFGEAVADNLTHHITYTLSTLVGDRPLPLTPLDVDLGCADIPVGDNEFTRIYNSVLRGICYDLQGVFSKVDDVLSSIVDTVSNTVKGVIDSITDTVSGLFEGLVTKLEDTFGDIVDAVENLVGNIVGAIEDALTHVGDVLASIGNAIAAAVSNVVNKLETVWQSLLGKVGDVLVSIGTFAVNVGNTIADKVKSAFDAIAAAVEAVLNRISVGFQQLIDGLVSSAEGGLRAIERVLGDIPGALRDISGGVVTALTEGIANPLSNLGTLLFEQVDAGLDQILEDTGLTVEGVVDRIFNSLDMPDTVRDRIRSMVSGLIPKSEIVTIPVIIGIVMFLIPLLASSIASPPLEELTQEVSAVVRQTLMPVPDVLDAYYRGLWNRDRVDYELHQSGFTDEKINTLLATGLRYFSPGEVTAWWLRGLITEDQLDAALKAQHVRDEDIAHVKEAAYFVPGPADLIRMTVREVFSPNIRQQFGQDEGFPEELLTYGKQVGLSETWARNYWAAHWELPSASQGFEMFHRGVIDEDTLELLLRALDVMPYWRGALKQIAYSPITRVDVRRLHKLGLIDNEQLNRRYLDLGYSPEDAAYMTEFTIQYNAPDEPENPGAPVAPTRDTALGLMEDGVLRPEDTKAVIQSLGYSEQSADIFVTQRQMEQERRERQGQADAVADQVRSGRLTFEQAQDALGALGFEPAELQRVLTDLQRTLEARNTLPTPEQLGALLRADAVTEAEYVETLQREGYSRDWAERFLKAAKRGG